MDEDKLVELAGLVVDAIIGATIDRLDEMRPPRQGRYADDAAASRATAIEVVAAALRSHAQREPG
jgi:hypothetical protein